jgi:hypothetical protein
MTKFLVKQSLNFISILGAVLIPCIGIYLSYFNPKLKPVDKDNCTCSCWDGAFKGVHPRLRYLSLYFNSEWQTLAIFVLAYIFMSFLQEIILFGLKQLVGKKLRISVIPLLALSCYAQIYGVWALINYLNERSVLMLHSQIFYIITESPMTIILSLMLDADFLPSLRTLLTLSCFSLLHITLAMPEKMLWSFIYPDYKQNVAVRDVLLMSGDFLIFLTSIYRMIKHFRKYTNVDTAVFSNLETPTRSDFIKNAVPFLFLFIIMWIYYKAFCVFD